MRISILVALLLLGCEPTTHGKAAARCLPNLTCDPGLQCQVYHNGSTCVPIGKPLP